MGQYALLAVLAVMTIGAVVLFNAQNTAQAADDDLTEYHEDRFGRELALVGLKRTERLLSQNPAVWNLKNTDDAAAQALYGAPTTTFTKGAFTGTFAVSYDQYTPKAGSTPELAYVTATGVYNGKSFRIRAVYEQGETDIGLPPSMRSSIVANSSIYFNGNVTVDGSVHTNGALTQAGGNGSYQVNGAGTYTGSESVDANNYTGGVAQADSIQVPIVVLPTTGVTLSTPTGRAVALTTQTTTLTTQSLAYTVYSNNTTNGQNTATTFAATGAGTQSNPYVLVINGNLNVSGDVRLLGYTRLYVSGNITIDGNISPVSATPPVNSASSATISAWLQSNLPNGGQLGIYATGNIKTNGNPTIVASLYANGNVEYWGGGNRLILGGITSRDYINTRGNARIFYTSANASILDPGANTNTPNGVRLVSYREWATR